MPPGRPSVDKRSYINKDISSALAVTRARSFFLESLSIAQTKLHPLGAREIARRSLHATDPGTASRTPTFRDYSQAQTSLAFREALEGVDDQSDARTPGTAKSFMCHRPVNTRPRGMLRQRRAGGSTLQERAVFRRLGR